jgi:IS30 family transposase
LHLSKSERSELGILLKSRKYALRQIAKELKRSVSTISDEIKRNSDKLGRYDSAKANHKSYVRRKYSKFQGMKIVFDKHLWEFIEKHLYDDQSPKAISGRIKRREKNVNYVSKNSIHRYIKSVYGRNIEAYRKSHKRKRRILHKSRAKLTDRTFINKRPKHIEKRLRAGHAESDFIESGKTGKGKLLVVVDRKTRAAFLERIVTVTISDVHKSFLKIKERFPELETITTDNDILLQNHKKLEQLLHIKIYFCDPYSSWQKGTVENTNKYIRRDIPKGSNISTYSKVFIKKLEDKLNRRILECLQYLTPIEALKEVRDKRKKRRRRA